MGGGGTNIITVEMGGVAYHTFDTFVPVLPHQLQSLHSFAFWGADGSLRPVGLSEKSRRRRRRPL